MAVVKGVARQVIIVKSPDPRLFEQAIFIVREEALQLGVSPDAVLREARRVADGYVRKNVHPGKHLVHVPAPAYIAAGALAATLCWCLALFF